MAKGVNYLFSDVFKREKPLPPADVQEPYRTIAQSGGGIIAYELHTRPGDVGRVLICSTVIKHLQADKDDYKSICRSVITDICRTMGEDNIEVDIFDDYFSYCLSDIDHDQHFRVLTQSESDSVNHHTVAIFYGNCYGANTNSIYYYPEAGNGLTERETFLPQY